MLAGESRNVTRAANPVPDDGRDGEVAALYRSHARAVWAVAYARHLDRDLALDVVQETFLRFWAQRDHGGAIENPRAWLMRVAKNLAEDHAKSAFRRNGTQPGDSLGRLSAAGPSPPDLLEQKELFAVIHDLLRELPPADRDILTMRYALDDDAPTIAAALGIPVTAVHMRLSRARQRLAEKLATHGVRP